MQNISPIKERILQFIDTHVSSKRVFYAKTGISRGTLESKTGISEDTFTKIFATYQNLSPVWVLTGKGNMEENNTSVSPGVSEAKDSYNVRCKFCDEKERIIQALQDANDGLKIALEAIQRQKT